MICRSFVYREGSNKLEVWSRGLLLAQHDYPISYTMLDCIEEWCSIWYMELRTLNISSTDGYMTLGVFNAVQHND